jgi:hypothetical protein
MTLRLRTFGVVYLFLRPPIAAAPQPDAPIPEGAHALTA